MSHSLSKKFTFGSLLLFALPTTVMMVVMSLYTIVDGVFVSRFVSTNALSSVNIVYPVINIVLGISVMLSMGSNAIVAKKMGEGRPFSARATAGPWFGMWPAPAGPPEGHASWWAPGTVPSPSPSTGPAGSGKATGSPISSFNFTTTPYTKGGGFCRTWYICPWSFERKRRRC